jgi:hypothetical protein
LKSSRSPPWLGWPLVAVMIYVSQMTTVLSSFIMTYHRVCN